MFRCTHVYLRTLRHSTNELTRAVHDVVPCNLSEIHHRAGNGLVALGLFLVQQRTFRLFRRKRRTEAWSTKRFAVGHAEPSQNGFGVVLLANRQSLPCLSRVTCMPKHKRYIAHVSHHELIHQLLLELLYQLDIASNHKDIVHI